MMSKYPKESQDSLLILLSKLPSFLLFLSLFFNLYILHKYTSLSSSSSSTRHNEPRSPEKTGLHHLVFGIGSGARHWALRRHFIELWWRPTLTRGFVFLDKPVNLSISESTKLPELKVSGDTTRFPFFNKRGNRAALRMTRIVSEMVRTELKGVRWFVMGDDDTIFFPDNLVRVLRKYDHTRMYYIGSNSDTHSQNIKFSYGMAFGGGGFAISYPLAKAIEKMQDSCIRRYPELYGLDDRIHACLSDLGVPLTKEPGFHQFDVRGDLFGLLAAHPISPLLTLHHLHQVKPIFPSMNHLQALQRLILAAKVDSANLMQQSICYDHGRNWTISVSWGYVVQILRGSIPIHVMERPVQTFLSWNRIYDPVDFPFDTRPRSKDPCQEPYMYFLDNVEFIDATKNTSRSEYVVHGVSRSPCSWKGESPQKIHRVEVYSNPNPRKWEEAPRRDCCKVVPTQKEGKLVIGVGECKEGEVIVPQLLSH